MGEILQVKAQSISPVKEDIRAIYYAAGVEVELSIRQGL